MHVKDPGAATAAGLLLLVDRGRFETNLLGVEEVPVLVHVVVVRVEALLAQVAEVVLLLLCKGTEKCQGLSTDCLEETRATPWS